MQVIVDSGSSSSNWALCKDENLVESIDLDGLNPFILSKDSIIQIIEQGIPDSSRELVKSIFFYGAGCRDEDSCQIISHALHSTFKQAQTITVESDLLAACRSINTRETCFVGILGTGSNVCNYKNDTILQKWPVCGYLLGDEGSGFEIGKRIIKLYCENLLSEKDKIGFEEFIGSDPAKLVSKVYGQKFPNRFIAKAAEFLVHSSDDLKNEVLESVFTEFFIKFERFKSQFKPEQSLHLVGSIAFNFQNKLTQIAKRFDVSIGSIQRSPLLGLIKYHK